MAECRTLFLFSSCASGFVESLAASTLACASQAHLPRASAVGRHYDPFPFHLLNHPGRAVVADSEPPLNHRDRGLSSFEHDLQRLIVKFIALIPAARTIVLVRGVGVENLHLVFGRTLGAQKIAHFSDFRFGDKRSM